jgi:hypothetical protein
MLPQSIKSLLWSYDTEKIDLSLNKDLVISQVLNLGNSEATNWLFEYYDIENIKSVAQKIPSGQWNKKSLNYWSLILGIKPQDKSKRVYE